MGGPTWGLGGLPGWLDRLGGGGGVGDEIPEDVAEATGPVSGRD